MPCPDCGKTISPVPLGINGEANESFRCYHCGGFWLNSWLANRINTKSLDKFPELGLMRAVSADGKGTCPIHSYRKLDRYTGDSVPQHLNVFRCKECGWWWFPKNTLFDYKPAQEAKVSYFKLWGMPADVKGLLLPVAALVVLVGGTAVTVRLIKQQQYILLNASGVISKVSITYLGEGKAMIVFESQIKLSQMEYKKQLQTRWLEISLESDSGTYMEQIEGLEEGTIYEFRILGKVYELSTNP